VKLPAVPPSGGTVSPRGALVRAVRQHALTPLLCLVAALVPAGLQAQSDVSSLAAYAGKPVTAIALDGHKVTKEGVIRRELLTRVGEPLELATLAADLQRLDNLSIFAQVLVEGSPEGEGVRLALHLREMPPVIPFVGMAYTEENGFSVGPGVSALNLTGRQISLSGRAYFGGTTQYWARVTWPWISGDHRSLGVYWAHIERYNELESFEEHSQELSPRAGTYLGEHGRLNGMFTLFRMRSDVPGKTLSPDNDDLLVRVGASLGWDTRDSWRFPVHGWQNELELWHTGGFLGGNGDFWTLNVDLRRWQPATPRQRLMVSGLLTLQSGTVGQDVPVYLRYHMGGANSIRGYTIGELGQTIYGKSQLIGTAEYSFNLMPLKRWDVFKWSFRLGLDVAVIADAGTAWSEPREFAMNRTRGGLGAGFRLLVPGSEMTRFDLGWSPAEGFNFHFASGSKPNSQRNRLR
jgi:outer membrane protein insertion porin family